jgi:hypothetical protein
VNNNDLAEFLIQLAIETDMEDGKGKMSPFYKAPKLRQCASALRNSQGERDGALREVLALPRYQFVVRENPNGGPPDAWPELDLCDGSVIQVEDVGALLNQKDEPTKPVGETPTLDVEDIRHLITRLEAVADLLRRDEKHMAMAKILADISALKGVVGGIE